MNQILLDRASKLTGKLEQIQSDVTSKNTELDTLKNRIINIENTQVLLQTTAKETQDGLKVHLEDIVQMALDTCFPDEFIFCIEFELKRGSTVCDMFLQDPTEEKDSQFRIHPMQASGGGLVDIISLALRLAVWTLSKPDNVIVLDEPFKFLSDNLRPMAGDILHKMSRKLGLQIIMVTHDQVLMEIADKIFKVRKSRTGVSKITVMEG